MVAKGVMVHRCVAAIICCEGRVLLCHRRADRSWYPDCWDLPGGHQQPGETAAAALHRELAEELGITVLPPLGEQFARLRSADIDLRIWMLDRWHGTITNNSWAEHDRLAWFTPDDLAALKLASVRYVVLLTRALERARLR